MSDYLTTKDVGQHFGCNPADVSYWCATGLVKALPRQRLRQPYKIPRTELHRLEEEGLPPTRRALEAK